MLEISCTGSLIIFRFESVQRRTAYYITIEQSNTSHSALASLIDITRVEENCTDYTGTRCNQIGLAVNEIEI